MMRACFVDCTPEMRALFDIGALVIPDDVTVNYGNPSTEDIIRICQTVDVLMVEHTPLSSQVLDQCANLKAVIFLGTGAETYIDLKEAEARGIKVLTTPGYGDLAVAEHAFALMMSASRRVARMDRDLRKGVWRPLGGVQLTGRKVAVIGLGGIGRTFADLCSGFGMRVSGWNRNKVDHPCYCQDLTEVLSGADFVSLHLALTDETAGFLGKRELILPKDGYFLVNTAQAQLVDEAALRELWCAAVVRAKAAKHVTAAEIAR